MKKVTSKAFFSEIISSCHSKLKKTPVLNKTSPKPSDLTNLLNEGPSDTDQGPLPPGVRLVIISDTHGKHAAIGPTLPKGDVLIHAGDFSNTGTIGDVTSFTTWFDAQAYDHRVFIAGNHDTSLDTDYYLDRGHKRFHSYGKSTKTAAEISQHCIDLVRNTTSVYLQDEKVVLNMSVHTSEDDVCNGEGLYPLHIYGSPWSSEFCDWAFNLERGQPSKEKWDQIPEDADVLITHGPPIGYGDKTISDFRCGCEDLLTTIRSQLIPPRVHIFGHIHEDRGAWHDGKTLFVNASTCTFNYRPTNAAIIVHLPYDSTLPARIIHEEIIEETKVVMTSEIEGDNNNESDDDSGNDES